MPQLDEPQGEDSGRRAANREMPLHRVLTVLEDLIYYAISAVLVVATAALLTASRLLAFVRPLGDGKGLSVNFLVVLVLDD